MPGLVLCVLRTCRAAWISSANTTSAPRPRACGVAATCKAASRFAGPSGPASVGLRIAPVMMNGASCGPHRVDEERGLLDGVRALGDDDTRGAVGDRCAGGIDDVEDVGEGKRAAGHLANVVDTHVDRYVAEGLDEFGAAEPADDTAVLHAGHGDRAAQREVGHVRHR